VIPDWPTERSHMVESQLRRRGIRDERVLAAMNRIPREEFVPPESRLEAYTDGPIPVGHGQTISQPYMVALMAECLELTGTETVLEIGAGCGYASAVLGQLAGQVLAIEVIPALAQLARENLRRTRLDGNITVIEGDGWFGYSPRAPYRAISVAAAAPEIPEALLAQLDDPGRLVIPVNVVEDQELRVVSKYNGRITYRVATLCRFVPLRGGWQ
jgi:protein-L-isoaspartate(D-aspartate) O-methyltransferase